MESKRPIRKFIYDKSDVKDRLEEISSTLDAYESHEAKLLEALYLMLIADDPDDARDYAEELCVHADEFVATLSEEHEDHAKTHI